MIATFPSDRRPCVTMRYVDRAQAEVARRKLKRHMLTASVAYCETCDVYHIKVDGSRIPAVEVKTLSLLAQGATREEIAREIGRTHAATAWNIRELLRKYYAANSANLVTIVIALGIVDPTPFVPMIMEKRHE